MPTGTIARLLIDKGFGFIKDSGGQEYFFHQSAIYGEGIQDLREGDSVEVKIPSGTRNFEIISFTTMHDSQ